jgi:hypothetical protein
MAALNSKTLRRSTPILQDGRNMLIYSTLPPPPPPKIITSEECPRICPERRQKPNVFALPLLRVFAPFVFSHTDALAYHILPDLKINDFSGCFHEHPKDSCLKTEIYSTNTLILKPTGFAEQENPPFSGFLHLNTLTNNPCKRYKQQ